MLAFALVPRYDILGLALAFAIANVVGALFALQVLSYKVPGFPLRGVLGNLLADGGRRRWSPPR